LQRIQRSSFPETLNSSSIPVTSYFSVFLTLFQQISQSNNFEIDIWHHAVA